jgi:uncharacterized protein YidB (DUF937 family)
MHMLSAGLGVDQMELPGDLASVMPLADQHRTPGSPLPQQRAAVSESEAEALAPWADGMELPGLDS